MSEEDQAHEHTHADGTIVKHLTSVGVDVGSTTTHLMFSRLSIGRPSALPGTRLMVLDRKVVYRSPIHLTPFDDGRLVVEQIQQFVSSAYQEAGIHPDHVDTGAVIATGEAARRQNARALANALSREAGHFVCATAGHNLEARLAAHGSGAVRVSRERQETILNIDVGGGTTKLATAEHGYVTSTAAVHLGARLVTWGPDDRVVRVESPIQTIGSASGIDVSVGSSLSRGDRALLARRMAGMLAHLLAGEPDELAQEFWLTRPIRLDAPPDAVILSGGVAEYVYGHEPGDYADLGAELGSAVKEELRRIWPNVPVLQPDEAIRATVIGASQFSLTVSGDTVFLPPEIELPMRNLAVVKAQIEDDSDPVAIANEIRETLSSTDPEVRSQGFVLALVCPPFHGYSVVNPLVDGLVGALNGAADLGRPRMVIFNENLAQVVGQRLARQWPEGRMICLDEVEVDELDYLDVGQPPPGAAYVPIIVKSLVF